MTTKPSDTQTKKMELLKVRPSHHRMLSIIAALDGKLLQDVVEEAVSEYIERRNIIIPTPQETLQAS